MNSLFIILQAILMLSYVHSSPKWISSSYTYNKIEIDGCLNDWNNCKSICFNGEKAVSENWIEISSAWDHNFLYLAFEVRDNNLQAYQIELDHPSLFLDDMVEVLFDPNNAKDSCWNADDIVYHINLLGIKKDDRGTKQCLTNPSWNGNANYRVKLLGSLNDSSDVDLGYIVEFRISWDELGLAPYKGLKIGINFANGDNDGKGRQLYDWVGAWPMRSPYSFGELLCL